MFFAPGSHKRSELWSHLERLWGGSHFQAHVVVDEFSSLQLQDCVLHLFSLAVSQGSLSVLALEVALRS